MKDRKKNKKIVTMAVLIIAIMVVAVVVLAHNNDFLKPSESSGSNATWKVEFTSIAEAEKTGRATSRKLPDYSSTKASFYVDLVAPGDSITYELQVSNLGTLDAYLQHIDMITSSNKEGIEYEILDLNVGDSLSAGEVKNFKVKVSYELDAQEVIPFNKPMSIVFTFAQKIK